MNHSADNALADPPVRTPLGTLLVESGFVGQEQVDEALAETSSTGERLGEHVVRRGWASEDDVARLLAEQAGLEYLDRASVWFDTNALTRLSREDAELLEALPVRVEKDRVMVAVAEPTEERLAQLKRLIGDDTVVVVVAKTALDTGIELLASGGGSASAAALAAAAAEPEPQEQGEEQPAPPPAVDPAADLATQARSFADSIAQQAEALQASQRRVAELEAELTAGRTALEDAQQRLAGVEAELAGGREAMQQAKTQLADVLQLLEDAPQQ